MRVENQEWNEALDWAAERCAEVNANACAAVIRAGKKIVVAAGGDLEEARRFSQMRIDTMESKSLAPGVYASVRTIRQG